MSATIFDVQRPRLAGGLIYKNLKLESTMMDESAKSKSFIKWIFVTEDLEEYAHFSFANATEFGMKELNSSLMQILSCYMPVLKLHALLLKMKKELGDSLEDMDANEMLQAFYKYIVLVVLKDGDANNTPVDIKLIFSNHSNAVTFPDSLFSKYKFITKSGEHTLVFSTEKYKKTHKRYAGQVIESQVMHEIDDTEDDGFASEAIEDGTELDAAPEVKSAPEEDLNAYFDDPEAATETVVEQKVEVIEEAVAPVKKKAKKAPKVMEPAVEDPFSDAIELEDDDEFPV